MKNLNSMEQQLGIYIHIPFCVRKCRYCDFLSAPADHSVRERYVRRLVREIEAGPRLLARGKTTASSRSIFIGGGTPSLLDADQIRRILEAVRAAFSVAENAEITMECNPGTGTDFHALKAAGINRLSFGVQSADAKELSLLGRIHTWEDAIHTVSEARAAGFTNINTDLIFSLPGQTLSSWKKTLERTLRELSPEHISAYSLIIEEGTPFYEAYHEEDERRAEGESTSLLPDEETEREMYWETQRLLEEHGYHRYEISNYALPGYESVHNTGYWIRRAYLGFGLGAASQIGKYRLKNTEDLQRYLEETADAGAPLEEEILLSHADACAEAMFLGLRLRDGVDLDAFAVRYGVTAEQAWPGLLPKLEADGLLICENNRVRLSQRGTDLSNYVFAQFL